MSQHYYAAVEGRVLNPTLRTANAGAAVATATATAIAAAAAATRPRNLLLSIFCNCHVQDCSASYKLESVRGPGKPCATACRMLEPVPNFKP